MRYTVKFVDTYGRVFYSRNTFFWRANAVLHAERTLHRIGMDHYTIVPADQRTEDVARHRR